MCASSIVACLPSHLRFEARATIRSRLRTKTTPKSLSVVPIVPQSERNLKLDLEKVAFGFFQLSRNYSLSWSSAFSLCEEKKDPGIKCSTASQVSGRILKLRCFNFRIALVLKNKIKKKRTMLIP